MERVGLGFLPVLAKSLQAPHELSVESSASVKVQLPTCHKKLLICDVRVPLQSDPTVPVHTTAKAARSNDAQQSMITRVIFSSESAKINTSSACARHVINR